MNSWNTKYRLIFYQNPNYHAKNAKYRLPKNRKTPQYCVSRVKTLLWKLTSGSFPLTQTAYLFQRQIIFLVLYYFFFCCFFFFFAITALSMIILSSMFSFSLKSFSTSASQSSQLSLTFSLIPSILRFFPLE